MNGAAGDAVDGEVAVLDGDLAVVDGGHGAAHAQKVVVAEALEAHGHILDDALGVAGDQDAVEALLIAVKGEALHLFSGDRPVGQQRGHALVLGHLAVLQHHSGVEVAADLVGLHRRWSR